MSLPAQSGRPVTAILYAPGTNCHEETASALELAGGRAELVLLRDLLDGRARLDPFQALVIPGGFSYGDHLGAGRVFATILVAQVQEELKRFIVARKPLLGICNGFQVLAEAGVLPGRTPGQRSMALLENASARFEDRKVRLAVSSEKCLWTVGLEGEVLEMPSAHGEGRALTCLPDDRPVRTVFRYSDPQGEPTQSYPDNPSGAPGGVAGITDETGMILGIMPHPERAALPAHRSRDGLKIFKNLIRWLEQ